MRTISWTAMAVLMMLAAASPVRAQVRGFVSGGAFVSWQPVGQSDCPYLCGPLGGGAFGLRAAAGAELSPWIAIGVEGAFGGELSGQQVKRVSGGTAILFAQHRDVIVSGVVKLLSPDHPGRVSHAIVAGASLAHRSMTRAGAITDILRQNPPPPQPVSEELTDVVFGVVGGIDLPVRVARRFAIVPSFRVHYLVEDDHQPDGVVRRGVSPWLLWSGVAVDMRF